MCCVKDCVGKVTEHIEDEVKPLHATFPQQPTTELNFTSALKSLITRRIEVIMSAARCATVKGPLGAFLYRFSHIKLFDNKQLQIKDELCFVSKSTCRSNWNAFR